LELAITKVKNFVRKQKISLQFYRREGKKSSLKNASIKNMPITNFSKQLIKDFYSDIIFLVKIFRLQATANNVVDLFIIY
jgi:hypothetical protein